MQTSHLYPILAAVGCNIYLARLAKIQRYLQTYSMLIVGTEWLVEAADCDAAALSDVGRLGEVFARAFKELGLTVVGSVRWHKFPGPGGVTGLALLTESHLACHTYPEFGIATFNLYCCRTRPRWAWEERLTEMLGASVVTVRAFERRVDAPASAETETLDETDAGPAREDAADAALATTEAAGGGAR